MHSVFIINPKAGKGNAASFIENSIKDENLDAEIYYTKCVMDANAYVKEFLEKHKDEKTRFIACGGDGTINEVFSAAVGYENASVSVYPCGSGNDFVKVFGGMSRFSNVKALTLAPEQKLDVMKVDDRYAINVTNFGFDTTVAMKVNEDRAKTGHGSKFSYTKGIVRALVKSMNNRCTVKTDGQVLNPDGRILLCTVANGQYVGGSFKCAPRAKTDDGLLEVCLCVPISRLKFVTLLGPYTNGEHIDNPKFAKVMKYTRAKKIEIEAADGFAYSLDGEIIHKNRFSIEIVPGALNFACPE